MFASILAALLALTTVYSTAMIYASLPTIRAWHQLLTVPVYMTLAVASGGLIFVFVLSLFRTLPTWAIVLPLLTLVAAFFVKRSYWQAIDNEPQSITAEDATGLGHLGRVRQLEPPHTQANYVMREMGFSVARKRAEKLRRLSLYLMFILPSVCLLLLTFVSPVMAPFFALVAVVSMGVGVVMERWLFFAEAKHVVMLYYGQEAA